MSRYDTGFREPPWVVGSPKEVMDWIEASHPDEDKDYKKEIENKYLDNLHMKFNFDVKHTVKKSICSVCRIIGINKVTEDIKLFEITELILRGLAKAKFKNIAEIIVDKKVLYSHPEISSDLRKTIDEINEYRDPIRDAERVEIIAILKDVHKSTADIKIKKIHRVRDKTVDIKIKGKIRADTYHTFLNYVNEKIGIKQEDKVS